MSGGMDGPLQGGPVTEHLSDPPVTSRSDASVSPDGPRPRIAPLPAAAPQPPASAAGGVADTGVRTHRAEPSRYPLFVLMMILAVDQADRFLLSAVFPLVKEEFRLSDSQLGTLSAAYVVVATLGVVPLGILADRVTRTKLIAWGTAVWSWAMILTGLANSYLSLFAARMFLGSAEATNGPSGFSYLSDHYPVHRRARILAIYQIGSIAGFIMLPVGGVVADLWGWRTAFHIYAVPGFILAVLAWRLPEPRRGMSDVAHLSLETYEAGTDSAYARMSTLQAFKAVMRIPTVLISVVANGLASFFIAGLGIWAVMFLVRYHDMSVSVASASLVILALAAVVGALSGGYLGDLLVARGLAAGRLQVAAVAKIVGVLLLTPAFLVDSTALMLVLFGLGSVTLTMPNPPLAAVRADVVHPDLRGRSASVTSMVNAIAGAASPLIFGLLSDSIGLRAAFVMTLPMMAVGGVVLLVLGPRFLGPDMDRMQRQLAGEMSMPGAGDQQR
jgi:MFS family permease